MSFVENVVCSGRGASTLSSFTLPESDGNNDSNIPKYSATGLQAVGSK
jgi:hypothetical protein